MDPTRCTSTTTSRRPISIVQPSNGRGIPACRPHGTTLPDDRPAGALLLRNSTPESYGRWLAEAATRQSRSAGRHGIVFVNAWNEWAEGAHLEPDALWGRAYLEVTRDVLRDCFGERDDGPDVAGPDHAPSISTEDLYHDLYEQFVALQQSSSAFLSYADRRIQELKQHYEAKLRWTNFQAAQITELNEWLVDQLERQADRIERARIVRRHPEGVAVPSAFRLAVRRPWQGRRRQG